MNEAQRYDMLHTGVISTASDVSFNDDTPTVKCMETWKDSMPFSVENIRFSETPTPHGLAVIGRLTISSSILTQGNESKDTIHREIVKRINTLAASAFLQVCGFTRDEVCRFLYNEYHKCNLYAANLVLSLPNAEQTKRIQELEEENEKLRKKIRLQDVIKEIKDCLADTETEAE